MHDDVLCELAGVCLNMRLGATQVRRRALRYQFLLDRFGRTMRSAGAGLNDAVALGEAFKTMVAPSAGIEGA